jgi:CheY-like chemotaxis protein
MSHEIRTPMNAILGFSQLMLRDASLTPAQREHLQIIDRNGEHLLALINDVLEMSKIEARRIALRPAPFDLHAFVHDLDTMFASRARAKGLAFSVRGVSGLPAAALGDEGRLRQIFVNLIANAVKFTTSGSISVRLEAHDLRGDRWQLVGIVADTGPGIAPEEMKHLFKQFEQASAGRETGSGTGLGLSISRELARLMDGDITVSSRVGAGSEFRVSVPLGIVDQPLLRTTETDRRQVVGLAPGQPACRILVVDDIEDNRRLLATMLGDMGFQIREAADGAQAVEAFARWAPHAILMDLRMPVMDGNEATRRIRAMPGGAATRIICLTASVFTENREQMLAAGGDDFLSKPFHANQLVEKLGQLLGVRFDFAELRTDREAPDGTSAPAHAEPLPIHLVTALRQALDTADLDRALELIGLVGTHDAALAARLRTVAERFDYDGAVTLLARAPTRSEPE